VTYSQNAHVQAIAASHRGRIDQRRVVEMRPAAFHAAGVVLAAAREATEEAAAAGVWE
jgi:hypothetical protein